MVNYEVEEVRWERARHRHFREAIRRLLTPFTSSLLFLLPLPSPLALNFSVVFAPPPCFTMAKQKALKSPDKPPKAPKEPKTSAPPVSGILVTVEGGGLAFSPAPTRKKLALEPSASSSSISFPASQESESSEGITSTAPRNTSSTIEPELEQKPLSLPFPPAFRHEDASPEEAGLIPTTLPPHVEHATNTPPTLSQTLDKESAMPTHASTHVEHTPAADSISDQPEDPIALNKMLLLVLQGQQALLSNSMRMEQEITSLKEDNKELRSQLYSGLNQLAKIVTEKNTITNQSIAAISNTHSMDFEIVQKNSLIINNNIKSAQEGIQHIEKEIDSLKEKLSSSTVEQKLDNLEKIIENLLPLKADTPMDMTPMPQSTMPLPPVNFNPRPSPFSHSGQSTKPSYASIAGSKIQYQSTTWQNTPINKPADTPAPFPKNTWTIRFPHKFGPKERPAMVMPPLFKMVPHRMVTKLNQKLINRPIEVILAKRTLKNNLALTFSQESEEKDIRDASTLIIESLGLQDSQAIFSRSVNWSKIVFKNTPCSTSINDESGKETPEKITDPTTLLKAVQESQPLLKEVTFVHPPDWTVQTLPEEAIYHNLHFTIEDPDNSIALNLIASEAIMFATMVRPRLWKDPSAPIPVAHFTLPY